MSPPKALCSPGAGRRGVGKLLASAVSLCDFNPFCLSRTIISDSCSLFFLVSFLQWETTSCRDGGAGDTTHPGQHRAQNIWSRVSALKSLGFLLCKVFKP